MPVAILFQTSFIPTLLYGENRGDVFLGGPLPLHKSEESKELHLLQSQHAMTS